MRRVFLPVLLAAATLLASCVSEQISLLDRELLIYKLEHEGKFYEDLEKEYEEEQVKTEALSELVLEARLHREEVTQELQAALEALRKQEATLKKAVAAARKRVDALKKEKAALDAAAKPPAKKPPAKKPAAKPPAKKPAAKPPAKKPAAKPPGK
jgi:peptidoglycan hydrolase CwlO-like protein